MKLVGIESKTGAPGEIVCHRVGDAISWHPFPLSGMRGGDILCGIVQDVSSNTDGIGFIAVGMDGKDRLGYVEHIISINGEAL